MDSYLDTGSIPVCSTNFERCYMKVLKYLKIFIYCVISAIVLTGVDKLTGVVYPSDFIAAIHEVLYMVNGCVIWYLVGEK
jgi:hypothetical protein